MSDVITTTSPNSDGEMLWCVHFKSSYYDNDPRMPGSVSINNYFYVFAKGPDEAIAKVEMKIIKVRKHYDLRDSAGEIKAAIVTIENLIPACDSSGEGCMQRLRAIELSCPEDTKRYRLGVCLIPVE